MAIYHCSIKPISRSTGRSAVGASAYRAGVCLTDERTGTVQDYTKKQGVEYSEIIMPIGFEIIERQELWNKAEESEKRKDARTAKEIEIALPSELSPEERNQLVKEYAQEISNSYECAIDLAIHEPNRKGDDRNYHAHLLLTTRKVTKSGLGEKTDLEKEDKALRAQGKPTGREQIKELRQSWERQANKALEMAGHKVQIDARSLENQGIKRQPTMHMGVTATAMARKGKATDRKREALELDTSKKLKELEEQEQGMARARQNMKEWQQEQAKALQENMLKRAKEKELKKQKELEQAKVKEIERAKIQEERQKARELERQNRPQKQKIRGGGMSR